MAEKYLILSDIHGNVSAFDAVLADCRGEDFAGIILLGDDIGSKGRSLVIICVAKILVFRHISFEIHFV